MKEYALNELQEWMENKNIRSTWKHEDYDDVMVYQNKTLNVICVKRDADGNVLDAWIE
jgi:hypothetical protein